MSSWNSSSSKLFFMVLAFRTTHKASAETLISMSDAPLPLSEYKNSLLLRLLFLSTHSLHIFYSPSFRGSRRNAVSSVQQITAAERKSYKRLYIGRRSFYMSLCFSCICFILPSCLIIVFFCKKGDFSEIKLKNYAERQLL